MTTVAADQLSEAINDLTQAASAALSHRCPDTFASLEKRVSEVEAYTREIQQAMWADEAKRAIRRLEKGDPLDEADKEVIRIFLVSDAERYVALENNFGDWTRELQRLVNDLERRANTVDRYSIGDLRGVLKDAIRLVPDIRNYLDEQQRAKKLAQALQHLDAPSRDMLARLIKEQLRSPKR